MEQNQNIRIAVDAVVFGYKEKQIYILLIKQKFGPFQGKWALPGGFVKDGEGLQDAVLRELKEETGVRTNYLEQLYTFGDQVNRDPRGQVISVAHLGLVNPSKFTLEADTDAETAQWFLLDDIPELAYDHLDILNTGIRRLQSKLHYQPVGFDLLDKEFPFSDLEALYQSILQKKIDRRNFRKKILSFGILHETDKIHQTGSGRPGKLFTFNETKYKELVEQGIHFEIKFA
ncbi:NUDIX hydrolase [Aureibacter tunicatorum]|uniref:8-oxo-dGTP diphosphatase n=1 Tax=Aureibacter tunicatorum TaxID=866807 RepID=A0AAE3XKV1_9BACT|nr:NUDIX domain-containing protein [Aureibacter tunicatorum]MDR6237601.1 8-oxo-dGTP diphosphatase [Aureibacter tunicatorum]BDD02635.1 NUDIX hydrolase [Aureibacter tunicatorum]